MDTWIYRHQKVRPIFIENLNSFVQISYQIKFWARENLGADTEWFLERYFKFLSFISIFFLIHAGQCVVTLGTGPEFDNRWRDIHLLPSHSYAVIGESCRVNPLAVQLSVYNRCAWNGRPPYIHRSGFLGSFRWRREEGFKCVPSYPVDCL